MNFSKIQKITEQYDGDLDTYENEVKLYIRLDKEIEGTNRVFLEVLKNRKIMNFQMFYLVLVLDMLVKLRLRS